MPRVLPHPAQGRPEVSLRRHGRHQHAGRTVVLLQILLHDETAHGVTDDHRRCGQTVGNHADVLDIVGDRTRPQRFVSRAAAMAAKAERQSAITLVGEEVQEIFIPAPGRMPGSVDEEQRDGVGMR